MFTGLSNTRNTNLYLIAALAITLVVILSLAVVPSIAAPKAAVIPVTGIAESPDYYQRHPELRVPGAGTGDMAGDFYLRHKEWTVGIQAAAIPVTGISESPDYFQRHPELHVPAGLEIDMSDFFVRHPELRTPIESDDLSDYFLRH